MKRLKADGTPLARDARHYADLFVLGQRREVRDMLASGEYLTIRNDYDATSRRYFEKSYRPPADRSFAESDSLFPPEELRTRIEPDYSDEVGRLYYRGTPPPFAGVLALMSGLKPLL